MKKSFSTIGLLIIPVLLKAQVLTGIVYNDVENFRIPSTIYRGTCIATATKENGGFKITAGRDFKIKSPDSTNKAKLFFEKVYLHTDRDVYLQGDTLWYKAYLTDAQTNILSPYSRNLYVELII